MPSHKNALVPEIKAVEHVAEIRMVKTMADGTFNVTLNLPEYCGDHSAFYMLNNRKMIKTVSVLVDEPEEEKKKANGVVSRTAAKKRKH